MATCTSKVKGTAEQHFHPFAMQFGKLARDETARIYDTDHSADKTAAIAI